MISKGKSTAKTFKGSETDIFNQSLKNVTTTKQKLIEVYKLALTDIQKHVQKVKPTQTYTITRLENLQKQVLAEIKSLNASSKVIITSGYVQNFDLSYYGSGYEYERWANGVVQASGKHYSLGYYSIDRDFVIASLNQRIAGETFGERMGANIARLRSELRRSIAIATIKGDSAETTARNIQRGIKGINKAMTKSVNSSLRIARTELLKAYSLGQEIATNQAEAAGVDVAPSWDSTLDGKTRQTHQTADGKKFILDQNAEWILTVGGVIFSSPRIPIASVGGNTAAQVINCRCRRRNNVFGFRPVKRVARLQDGTWQQVNSNLNYPQWAKTLEGKKEIQRTLSDRALRAKELRIMRRADGRKFTPEERSTLASIRRQIKGRVIGNVGTRV